MSAPARSLARLSRSTPATLTAMGLLAAAFIAAAVGVFRLTIGGAVALYFVIWWTLLFAVLPLRNQPETRPDRSSSRRGGAQAVADRCAAAEFAAISENARRDTGEVVLWVKLDFPGVVTEIVAFLFRPASLAQRAKLGRLPIEKRRTSFAPSPP